MVAEPAHAASNGASITATARVVGSCDISTTGTDGLAFGTHAGVLTDVDNQGMVRVRCAKGINWEVYANPGLHAQGSDRRMKHQALNEYITYTIHPGTFRAVPFPSAAGGTTFTATGALQDVGVYGRITPAAAAGKPSGTYSDTLTLTVAW